MPVESVMPGLDPGIHAMRSDMEFGVRFDWRAGGRVKPGHDAFAVAGARA
jgi:hypothetical protein